MIHYTISCINRMSQNVQIKLIFEAKGGQTIELGLPAWRPGRYEFQTYAKNIFGVKAYGADKKALPIIKTQRNTWALSALSDGPVEVFYEYSCTQFDAGGSWIDDTLIYINPINCLFYLKGRENEPCTLTLDFPDTSSPTASNLSFVKGTAQAKHYFQLADSPFFISAQQGHEQYELDGVRYHIWTHGEIAYDKKVLLKHFAAFTYVQVVNMEVFPEKEYHFLLLLLPFTHYHGVEHQQSTVITLGPAQDLAKAHLYEELISISSHELYHAWNICKIRPAEMYPYRLEEENYFRTGFVAEGVTTYLGEYFLRQSGFFSEERFLLEIEQWFNRHRLHRGLQRASLADSSFDLWLDGYTASSADHKVSIYVAGALSAIALDLKIRLANPGQSIFNLMRTLYQEKALQHKGYTELSLQEDIRSLIGKEEKNFWDQCITGHSVDLYVTEVLKQFGISVKTVSAYYDHERLLGIKLKPNSTKLEIAKVQEGSPSAPYFMMDDIILAVNDTAMHTLHQLQAELEISQLPKFSVQRKGREVSFSIRIEDGTNYWATTSVQKNSEASDEQKLRYEDWMRTKI
jgi:predicted metalloprotease with PDZ domain